MISYAVLLALAIAINAGDMRMLALSAVIGAGIFAPVPAENFYLICALGEILIALLAYRFQANASRFIIRISTLLVASHGLGWWLNGYPASSPYHFIVKISEHAELLACILLSNPVIKKMNHGKN